LVRSAEIWNLTKKLKEFGVEADSKLLWSKVIDRKEHIVKSFEEDKAIGLKERGIDLIKGEAVFTSESSIKVNNATFTADKFVLALGSKAARPPIPGIEHTISSTDALNLRELPKSILIIGGGVIALEFSHIFASVGVDVTIVEMTDRLLSGEDEDSSRYIQNISEKIGINILLNSQVTKINVNETQKTVEVKISGEKVDIEVEQVMLAAGRIPNTDGLGLRDIGVQVEKSGIRVNEYLQTSVNHIYAGGDGIGGYMLTPVASYEGRMASRNAIKGNAEKVDYSLVTRTTFTHPPIASIGLTEEKAKEKGFSYETNRLNFKDVGAAVVLGETDGFVKILYDKEDKKLIGAHIIGARAEELIHEFCNRYER